MTDVDKTAEPELLKFKKKTSAACLVYFTVLLSGAGWYTYNHVEEKAVEIQSIKDQKDSLRKKLDQMIQDYNKADGYQKIRLNEDGYIEYYDIKVKSNPPVALGEEDGSGLGVLSTSESKPPISLESHFESEITPELYAEINRVLEKTTNQEFKKLVATMMKDGKITNGEYSEISIPLAMLLKEVELTKAKEALSKSLK